MTPEPTTLEFRGVTQLVGPRWTRVGTTAVRGHATVDDIPLEGAALARRLSLEPLETGISAADGGFAAIQVRPDRLVAAVDRVRSVPLFFAEHAGRVILGDDAHWIAERLPAASFDPVAQAEFLALGYVTGTETLHPAIRQLSAGQTLTVPIGQGRASIGSYFRYSHGPYWERTFDELLDAWAEILGRVTRRLVASVGSRPIVLPLSAGLDSRLLGLELHRAGFENVQTFTYGVPGNEEAKVAERVAGALGFSWTSVPYSREAWRQWYRTPEYAAYVRYADGLSTLPHIQDWPAIWELQRSGRVQPDAIFVPGHNGGFLFGENGNVHRIARPTMHDLVVNLERVHYRNVPILDPALRGAMRRRLVESLAGSDLDRSGGATSAWERWEWQERQSKFMCNSVRAYEFWGYDWRLPLWDVEAIEFWQRMPLAYRARARLHRAYVGRATERAGIALPGHETIGALRSALTRDYLPETVKRVGRRIRTRWADRIYAGHPMGWYGIISREQFRRVYATGSETINSILALDQMGRLPPDRPARRTRDAASP